jgi:hypothetical protein
VAALIQSTPFLALGSNTPKVEGLLEDIGIESTAYLSREWLSLGYHEMQDVITARLSQWNDAAAQHASAYTLRAVHAIAQLWDVVADIVKQPNPCQLLSPVNSNATSQHIDRPASQFSVLDNYQTHERQQINQQLSESQRHLESEKELNAALTAQNGCLMADLDRLRRESELANASLQNENTDLTGQNGRLTTELDRLRRESEMARATLQHELATPLWKKAERAIRVRRRAAVQTLVRQVTRICGQ